MTGATEVLFVEDRCYLSDPGRLFDASRARPVDVTGLVPPVTTKPEAYEARRLLLARTAGTYLDYSAPDAADVDHALMSRYLAAGPVPPPECPVEKPPQWLPHPAFPGPRGLVRQVSELLVKGFGVLREASFLDLFPVYLKGVPSKGARHPFDAYVVTGEQEPLPAGVYRYLPSAHALGRIDDEPPGIDGLFLVTTVLFERVQWRYREVAGYCDLLLDLGHLRGVLRCAADGLGLELQAVGSPVSFVPLVEEVVMSWRVVGER